MPTISRRSSFREIAGSTSTTAWGCGPLGCAGPIPAGPTRLLYPAPAFLQMCLDAGCPVALSSDAHVPEDVGRDYDAALELLERLGVGELAVFERRERRLEAIG